MSDTLGVDPAVFDAVVVGGGPAGATAATALARRGRSVLLLDRAGRIKPCGGAIPPKLIEEFAIPPSLLVARATAARMISPQARQVDMPITGGFVGMVDREIFDEWLRARAAAAGATRCSGTFESLSRDSSGAAVVHYRRAASAGAGESCRVRARVVIGADGARSRVARQCIAAAAKATFVFAYHEIVRSPTLGRPSFDGAALRDPLPRPALAGFLWLGVSPWRDHQRRRGQRRAAASPCDAPSSSCAATTGLDRSETLRCEGAPIPLRPLSRWDNGRDVILAGDAAGVVAPASGEGIYYAMTGGRLAAEAARGVPCQR